MIKQLYMRLKSRLTASRLDKLSLSFILVSFGVVVVSAATLRAAQAAPPPMPSPFYNYFQSYDNSFNIFVGASQCPAYLTAERSWLSLAGASGVDSTNVSPTQTGSLALQLNNMTMPCSVMTQNVQFPASYNGPIDWASQNSATQLATTQYVSNPVITSGQGGTVTFPGATTTIANNGNPSTKYWVGGPLPLTYTPPNSSFSRFSTSQDINIQVEVREYNTFLNSANQLKYSCVADPNHQNMDTPPDIRICQPLSPSLIFTVHVVVPQPNASCTSSAPLVVAAGSPFTVSPTMTNNGQTVWNGLDDALKINLSGTQQQTLGLANFFVSPGQTTGFIPDATFTAPQTGGSYTVNYQMDSNGAFGQACSIPVTVRSIYNYIPQISTSNASTALIPADSAPVSAGQTISLTATILNNQAGSLAPGDPYNWSIKTYSAPYQYGASSVAFGGDQTVAASTGTGVPANSSDAHNVSYTVPANTPDGTQICFYSDVAPASRTSITQVNPVVAYRASNFSSPMNPDNGSNIRTVYAGGVTIPNDMCVEVENIRTLNLSVTQGDVHAGGGVGAGCSLGTGATGTITGNKGSYAQYVASANSWITTFPTGGNGTTNGLTLGNVNPGQLGAYGIVCRPDMAAAADSYIATRGSQRVLNGAVNLASLGAGLYTTGGPVTVFGVVNHPITIYDKNGYGVTVWRNVTYNTSSTLASLPSFGVISNGGNIDFDSAVTQADGFYVAQQNPVSKAGGVVNTCIEHTKGQTGDCPNPLTVLGSLLANSFSFGRTGTATHQSGTLTTESITQSGLLYLAPPPAFGSQPNSSYSLPLYEGEGVPLY